MPRLFKRILSFQVEGEVYDTQTRPEDILRNYDWTFKDYNDGQDKIFMCAHHNDSRGRITKISKMSRITKPKHPDTEYFVI